MTNILILKLKRLQMTALRGSRVLSDIASERNFIVSSDLEFCKFIYHKMREVPDGEHKDEMQLKIQHVINQAKHDASSRRGSSI